jgi:hypothetical protein
MQAMDKRPAFMREFKIVAGSLWLHTGVPVKALAAENFVEAQVAEQKTEADPAPQNKAQNAGFWILEGYLMDYDLESSSSLLYYLENRGDKSLAERWVLYLNTVEIADLGELVAAYTKTRRHVFETEAELSLEQKKSA